MSRTTAQGGSDGRRGGGNPVGAAVGVQGFVSATNYERSAVNDIMPGSAAGFFYSVAVHVLSLPTASGFMIQSGNAGVGGFRMQTDANPWLTAIMANGVGASISSPVSVLAAGAVGKILLLTGVLSAVPSVRLYRAGAQVGAGTAIVGYTPAIAGQRSSLGVDVTGLSGCPWARIVGALYGTGIPIAADALAHYNACKAANTMESMTGAGVTNINRWQAKDNLPNAATWVDDIGGMVLTKTGTLSSVIFNPTWE